MGLSLTFENPNALWLLILVPAFYLVGHLGTAYLARPVRRAAIVVRLALVAALVLALAQPVIHRTSDQLSVVFAVDRSASVSVNGASAADRWLQQALQHAGPDDHTGIIEFGANAVVKQAVGADAPNPGAPPVDPSQSNLAAALHLGTVLLPSDGARRIVVLSDGQDNVGDAPAEARQDTTRDVHVDVVLIGPPANFKEFLIDSLSAPPYVRSGQAFDLNAVIQSTTAADATLSFSMDGRTVSQSQVHLRAGSNRFGISLTSKDKGFHTFQATISGPNGTYPQNKTAFAYTVVKDAGSVVVVASNPREAGPAVSALESSGAKVTLLAPGQIPPSLSAMKSYDSVVVVDTPATDFSLDQMKTIAGFAHDLGHGLVFVGGPQSYGQGKYDGTPLSDALPVQSGVPGNVQSGNVALVIVIDKSGSMDSNAGGVKKMAMADKSAQLATGLLAPNDDVGIEAFDTTAGWVVPLQRVGTEANRGQIENQIGQISASGGTDIFAALQLAYQGIHRSSAQYKHIILMSDGNSLTESDYNALLQHIHDERITLSTIAIGDDADKNLLQMLASRGGGSYYYVDNASMIPLITTKETQVVRGSAKVDAPFQPQIARPSPLLEGFAGNDLPQLKGYVVTTARREATVALQSDRRDPVLAQWNYGLGRVVAWTSDLTGQWAADWLGWNQFAKFWGQTVNWSMGAPGDPELQISSSVDGSVVGFRVDVVNDQGVFQDLLDLRARVPSADSTTTEIPLIQTRTGRYEAKFRIDRPGAYPIEVVQYDQKGRVTRDEPSGVVISYPAEYRNFGVNDKGLATLAALTGGRILRDPAEAFDRTGLTFTGQDAIPIWPLLLALAAILFPIDVAIRRLRVDPLDLAGRGWERGRDVVRGWSQRLGAWAHRPLGAAR